MRKPLLLLGVAILAVGAFGWWGVPRMMVVVGRWRQRQKDLEVVGKLEERLANLLAIDEQNLGGGLAMVFWALPEEFDISRTLPAVSRQAEKAGLEVREYRAAVVPLATKSAKRRSRASKGKKKGGVSSQRFRLAVEGSWESWLEFLDRLEEMAPIVRVVKMKVGVGQLGMSAEVTLDGYFASREVPVLAREAVAGGRIIQAPVKLNPRRQLIWKEVAGMDFSIYTDWGEGEPMVGTREDPF